MSIVYSVNMCNSHFFVFKTDHQNKEKTMSFQILYLNDNSTSNMPFLFEGAGLLSSHLSVYIYYLHSLHLAFICSFFNSCSCGLFENKISPFPPPW